jgi:hypothetical protein
MDTNAVALRVERRPHMHVYVHAFLPNVWKCGLCGDMKTEEAMPCSATSSAVPTLQ